MQFLGIPLMLLGVYLLGQNIVFSTRYAYGWWRDVSAVFSVLAIASGVLTALYATETQAKRAGWMMVALGIVAVFMAGSVFLTPTSLAQFLAGLCAMASGYQLFTTGKVSL